MRIDKVTFDSLLVTLFLFVVAVVVAVVVVVVVVNADIREGSPQRYINKNRVHYRYLDNEVSCQQLSVHLTCHIVAKSRQFTTHCMGYAK